MTRGREKSASLFSIGRVVGLGLVLSPFCLLLLGQVQSERSASTSAFEARSVSLEEADQAKSGGKSDPPLVLGYQACRYCHKSETLAWMSSKHFRTQGAIGTFTSTVKEYCDALNISKAEVANSLCADCHATKQVDFSDRERAISGVSCESCHGAAGGEHGWLNRHAVYGPNVSPRKAETKKHRGKRIESCESAGMVRSERLYAVAKNCLGCHLITDEKLVNAGHHPFGENFELLNWSIGEVRHNFHEHQMVNADGPSLWMAATGGKADQRRRVKYIVGLLVDMEVSLQALSSVTNGEGDFAAKFAEHVGGVLETLQEVLGEVFGDEVPDDLSPLAEDGKLAEIVAEVAEGDFSEKETREAAAQAAKSVRKMAMAFASNRDGSKLDALGTFIEENVGTEGQGDAYSPSNRR